MELPIVRTHAPGPMQASGPTHRNRLVVLPLDFAAQSPFLLMAEDWFSPPAGFPTHPHRGLETVTIVLEGQLEHRDHTGGHGLLGAGDVQFMTAGGGVLHSEMPGPGGVHSLQLWLNLPAAKKRAKARYQDLRAADAPLHSRPGVEARVYAGKLAELEVPSGSVWPLTLFDLKLDSGAECAAPIKERDRAFVYVIDGAGEIGGARLRGPEIGWTEIAGDDARLRFRAQTPLRAFLFAAAPIDEPVVARGPFVMNTMAEIEEALADYQAGRLTA